MSHELWAIHLSPSGRLEISGTVNIDNAFTAAWRYALIAGRVWSGTMACPPPEGDWMTSAPRIACYEGWICRSAVASVARGSWL